MRQLSCVESKRFAAQVSDTGVDISDPLGDLEKPARSCARLPSRLLMQCDRIKDRSAITAVQHLKFTECERGREWRRRRRKSRRGTMRLCGCVCL